jgi:hypothetical protein
MKTLLRLLASVVVCLLLTQGVYAGDSMRGVAVKGTGPEVDLEIEGTYWALIIGINKYANLPKEHQLAAARPDAEGVAEILQRKYSFDKERIVTLYDGQASRREIIKQLRTMAKMLKENDNLLIYYAGHGQYDKDTQLGGWIPADAEFDDPSSWISNEDVRSYLKAIKARHVFTIADSCFSESLMGKTRSLGPSDHFDIKELYKERSRWIMTSGGLYPVPDAGKANHSIFAYHLLKILENNQQKYLTPDEMIPRLRTLVSNETQQTPKCSPISGIGDEGGQFVFVLAHAQVPTLADRANQDSGARLEEERKRIEQEKATMAEEIKKMKEKALQEVEQELRAKAKQQEQELQAKTKQQDQERLAKEKAQQDRIARDRRRLEQEKRDMEKQRKEDEEGAFVPPTF